MKSCKKCIWSESCKEKGKVCNYYDTDDEEQSYGWNEMEYNKNNTDIESICPVEEMKHWYKTCSKLD